MSIRIDYTPVQALGELAQAAGQAQAQQADTGRLYQIHAQQQALAHQQEMAELQHKFNMDRMYFDSFLQQEAQKRAKAWELEKMEANSRLQFETQARLKAMAIDAAFQQDLGQLLMEQQKVDQKRKVLEKAREDKRITEEQYEQAMLGLDIGTSADRIWKTLFPEEESRAISWTEERARQLLPGELEKQEYDLERRAQQELDFWQEQLSLHRIKDFGWGGREGKSVFGGRGGKWLVDEKGDPIRPATPEDEMAFERAKQEIARIFNSAVAIPPVIPLEPTANEAIQQVRTKNWWEK